MRCADFGPTPGRQRSASISSSSAVGDFILEKSSERQLHPRRQAQTARQRSHLLLHRGLDLALGVVDRGRHQVFEHLLVVGKEGRIDVDPLDVVPAGHRHPDHARTRLTLDLDRGELLLELGHVFLHLLGLPHQPRKRFHRPSLRHWAGLIEDSTMVASKFSTRSRTNASWLIAEAARPRAVLPVVSLIVTARRTGLPKRSCNASRSLSWKLFSARCLAEGGTRSSSVSPSKDLSSLTWASCFAIPPRSSELASLGQSPSNTPWAAVCGSPTRFSVPGRLLPAGPLRPGSPAPRVPGANASMRSSAMVKPANSSGASGRSCRPWIAI